MIKLKYKLNNNINIDIFDNQAFVMTESDGVVDITKTLLVENVGFDILKMLMAAAEVNFPDICQKIGAIYEVDEAELKEDIEKFLNELVLAGIVRKSG